MYFELLPIELSLRLLETLRSRHEYVKYITSFLSCDGKFSIGIESSQAFPTALTFACINSIPSHITRIVITLPHFDDAFVGVLALCPCAPKLARLTLRSDCSRITDASAHCWEQFSNLRRLKLKAPSAGLETIQATSKLSLLEVLSLSVDRAFVHPKAISSLLFGGKLPCLRKLSFPSNTKADYGGTSAGWIVETLLSRSSASNELLQDLGLHESDIVFSIFDARLVRQLCPNLDISGAMRPVRWGSKIFEKFYPKSQKSLCDMKRLTNNGEIAWDPVDLAAALPDIRTLKFADGNPLSGNYAGFSCLHELSIDSDEYSSSFVHVTHIPKTLRRLRLCRGTEGMEDFDALNALNALYDLISTQAQLLEDLVLAIPCLPDPARVRTLLKCLACLQNLELDHSRRPRYHEPVESLVLSHETLKKVFVLLPNMAVHFGYCPAMPVLTIGHEDDVCSSFDELYPNATELLLIRPEEDCSPLYPVVCQLGERLHDLEIRAPLCPSDLAQILRSFRTLTRLRISISGTELPPCGDDDLRSIFVNLPLLLSLYWFSTSTLKDLDYVRHGNLSDLELLTAPPRPTDRPPSEWDRIVFRCSQDRLPNLRSFNVGFHAIDVVVEDSPRLEVVTISYSDWCSATVKNCCSLRLLYISECTPYSVTIVAPDSGGTPRRKLEFEFCNLSALVEGKVDLEQRLSLPVADDEGYQISSYQCIPSAANLLSNHPHLRNWIL